MDSSMSSVKRIRNGMLVVTGGNHEFIVWKSLATRLIRKKYETETTYESYGCTYEKCKEIHKDFPDILRLIKNTEDIEKIEFKKRCFLFDPLTFAPLIRGRKVVLFRAIFDEIDKAEPDVLSIFLQAFDQGKLTDYAGNEIYLNNLIILMTCNIGFERKNVIKIKDEDFDEEKKDIIKSIENYFTKEFLGRVDEIIIFNKLTDKIIDGFINQKLDKLIEFNKKDIKIGEKLRNLIKEYGFSNEYGARRLNNIIDKYIGKVLAEIKYKEKWDEIKNIFIDIDENNNLIYEIN
jgi:hypothetical protein